MQLIIVIKHAPQVLDRRTAVFPKLLSLNGRLELALAQLSRDDPQESTLPSATYDEEVEDAVDEHDDLEDEDVDEDVDEEDKDEDD